MLRRWPALQDSKQIAVRMHMQLVNKQGGYLAIKELRTLRRWNDVPEEEKYALPATLKEASKHFHRLTCALGFDPDPASGYSAKATFSKLIEYIEFGDSLPDGAQPEWNRFVWSRWLSLRDASNG